MPGAVLVPIEADKKRYENALVQELTKRAVSQGVVDTPAELVVRDILPLSDLGGSTTGATSASAGYRTEEWMVNLLSYQQDGSTASAAGSYNTVVNVDLNKQKVIGILGVQKRGEDRVPAVRFSLGSGAKIKDIWQIDGVPENGLYWAENPAIYNSTNTMKIEYYLSSVGVVQHVLVGKTAEAKGDTILGAE